MKYIRFQILPLAILFILLLYFAVSILIFVNKSEVVKAKITKTEYIDVTDSDSTDWYKMNMEVISGKPSGKILTDYYFETGLTDPEFKIGQIVELYYNEKDPMDSEIKNFWVQWGPPILIGMILIFYILVLYVISIVQSKKKKPQTGGMKINE